MSLASYMIDRRIAILSGQVKGPFVEEPTFLLPTEACGGVRPQPTDDWVKFVDDEA